MRIGHHLHKFACKTPMGFISTGCGYKRQKSDRLYCLRPKVTPRPKNPVFCASLPSPSPTPPPHDVFTPSPINSLQDLPADILLLIYCYSGVGESNNMALMSRNFHLLIPLVHEHWWLEKIIKYNFLADLNTNVSTKWRKKMHSKYAKLPSAVRDSWTGLEFLALPDLLLQSDKCLDLHLFHHKFVDGEKIRHVAGKFGSFTQDTPVIAREQALRNKYLQYKYAVLARIVQMFVDHNNSEPPLNVEQVHADIEASAEIASLKQKLGIANYRPCTHSGSVPLSMYVHLTPSKIEAIFELAETFGMAITRVPELASAIVTSLLPETAALYLLQLTLHVPPSYSYDEVVSLLRTLVSCRERILLVPMDLRDSSPYSSVVDQVYTMVEDALAKFYSVEQKDDEMVWLLLRQLEIPALLDLVVGLGGSPDVATQL